MPIEIFAALLLAVFAKGQGKPGTYTTRDGTRSFKAGSKVPTDLPKDDYQHWAKEGYILEPKDAEVDEVGGVAHDVPDDRGRDLSRTARARRPREKTDGERTAVAPKSSLREDPTIPDKDAELMEAHRKDAPAEEGVGGEEDDDSGDGALHTHTGEGEEESTMGGAANDGDTGEEDTPPPPPSPPSRTGKKAGKRSR